MCVWGCVCLRDVQVHAGGDELNCWLGGGDGRECVCVWGGGVCGACVCMCVCVCV